MRAVTTSETKTEKQMWSFCEKNGLRHKAIKEIRKIRQQLTNQINLNMPDLEVTIEPKYILFIYNIMFITEKGYFLL